jgi:protocatechuate 3,4-dioxygenase beta subunit
VSTEISLPLYFTDNSTGAPYLRARDAASVLNTTHLSGVNYTPLTPETTLFSSINSCILSAEVTQGPYYASGEYIRRNLIEDQEGVEMIIDLQVIDMATCEPVVNSMIDLWRTSPPPATPKAPSESPI